MKLRVAFVDDEDKILQGIRRLLRKKRNEWDMVFYESGQEALDNLDEFKPDIVVSDMRMPQMNGAELLGEVMKRRPETARIILSGFAEEESIMRTIGPAQQFLAKPCDQDMLVNTIDQTFKLRKILGSEKLRKLASGIKNLPTPNSTFLKLNKELENSNATTESVADILSEDVALTALILKLTNSAYFGLPQNISDTTHAVQLLGFDTIKSLVLMSGFFSAYTGDIKTENAIEKLSLRSLSIGCLAKNIARDLKFTDYAIEQAACAGMLSHVGTLLLLGNWPERFTKATEEMDKSPLTICEAERKVFGADHAEMGAYLLGLWGFSDPILEAVTFHHNPQSSLHEIATPITVVHVAQFLCRTIDGEPLNLKNISPLLDMEYLSKLGLDDRLESWNKYVLKLKRNIEMA